MSEKELFIQMIPQIAETIVILSHLDREKYASWKEDYLGQLQGKRCEAYGKKILTVIELFLKKNEKITEMDVIYEYFSKYLEDESDMIDEVKEIEEVYLKYVSRMGGIKEFDLDLLIYRYIMAYKKQGFINGFRYAEQLLKS